MVQRKKPVIQEQVQHVPKAGPSGAAFRFLDSAHLLALRCLWVRGGVSRPFHFAGYGAACSCPEGGREAGISELDESVAFACMILHETQKRGPHSSS